MTSGICWPFAAYDGTPQVLDPSWLTALKAETACTWLRFDCDHRNGEDNYTNVKLAHDAGFEVLPLLQADYAALIAEFTYGAMSAEQRALNLFTIDFVAKFEFPYVEVLNEPHTMHGVPAHIYADVCNSVGQEIRTASPQTQIIVAAEILQPDRKGPTPQRYFLDVADHLVPDYWDLAGIHHYREPGPPSATRFANRADEHRYVLDRCSGKAAVTTEIGWRVGEGGVTLEEQAVYDVEELRISQTLGMPFCCLYAHTGDFGVLSLDGEPRPVARAIRHWNLAHSTLLTT